MKKKKEKGAGEGLRKMNDTRDTICHSDGARIATRTRTRHEERFLLRRRGQQLNGVKENAYVKKEIYHRRDPSPGH